MAITFAKEAIYVVVWDYDAAPDGGGYYPWKVWRVKDLAEGKARALNALDDGTVPGAGVYQNGQLLQGWNGCRDWPFGACQ